jgi:hypothetical protein
VHTVPKCSEKLCRAYISRCEILLINPYADWQSNMLVDEDLKSDVLLFLQGLCPEDISVKALRDYLNQRVFRKSMVLPVKSCYKQQINTFTPLAIVSPNCLQVNL